LREVDEVIEELERRVRERGVRVEERVALLRLLACDEAREQLDERRRKLIEGVRRAAATLRGELA